MDQAQILTLLGLAMNAVVMLLMIASFFRRYATKDDIKDLSDKLVSVEDRLGNVEAGQAALDSRLGNVEDRLGNVEDRLGNVEDRLGNVEIRLGRVESQQAALEGRFDILETNVREIGKKADASLDLHHAVRGDMKVLQASQNRLESYFETPKLKSS